MLVLDSGAVTFLAQPRSSSVARIRQIRSAGEWPPRVPTIVMVECLSGQAGPDANANRLLKGCELAREISPMLARRAAALRSRAGRGSAVDAIVVAAAEPGGMVLTGDPGDLRALAEHAREVTIRTIR